MNKTLKLFITDKEYLQAVDWVNNLIIPNSGLPIINALDKESLYSLLYRAKMCYNKQQEEQKKGNKSTPIHNFIARGEEDEILSYTIRAGVKYKLENWFNFFFAYANSVTKFSELKEFTEGDNYKKDPFGKL